MHVFRLDLGGNVKNIIIYSNDNEKLLKGYKQDSNITWHIVDTQYNLAEKYKLTQLKCSYFCFMLC